MIRNIHKPVMLEEVISFIPKEKKLNIIDATFGGGGYSKLLLENFEIKNLIAIDRDPMTKSFSNSIKKKFPKKFNLINGCFSNIDNLIKEFYDDKKNIFFDAIIFDLGLSSNQLEDSNRGFSFLRDNPLDMNMGSSNILASDIINKYTEKQIADIIYNFGEDRNARKIAKIIVKNRKIKKIKSSLELSNLISNKITDKKRKNFKINPATKTFQALRIYVNDELNELKIALKKSESLLAPEGKLIIVSFQSLEDRIVKDFFNHKSGKKWRSSRHYPELADEGPITFKIITKKPIRPNEKELFKNPRSRSAKLRVAQKIN